MRCMKTVTIFTTPTCHYCKLTKEFLRETGIEYVEKDVTQNDEFSHEMFELTGQMGVPVVVVKQAKKADRVMVGFQKSATGPRTVSDVTPQKVVTGQAGANKLTLCSPFIESSESRRRLWP